MNIFKKFLLVILSGIWSYVALAQDSNPLATSAVFKAPIIGKSYVAPAIGRGSPYLVEGWHRGSVVLASNDTITVEHLKFNCLKNELLWTNQGKLSISIDNNLIKSFGLFTSNDLSERRFEKATLKLPFLSDTIIRFVEVMAEGRMSFYTLRNIYVENEIVAGNNGGQYSMPVYSPEPVFYIQLENYSIKQIKINKKSLIKAYPEASEKIHHILRSAHLGRITNEYEMVEAVKLISNNLQ
jgi:hypothetical protein